MNVNMCIAITNGGVGQFSDLLEHVLAELELLRQALVTVLQVDAKQSLLSQLLLGKDQARIQL